MSDLATVRDFTFEHPDEELTQTAGSGSTEVYEYPGEYAGGTAEHLAQVRLEEAGTYLTYAIGTSDIPAVRAGVVLDLSGHPADGHDGEWLVVWVEHTARHGMASAHPAAGEPGYSNRFGAIPLKTQFRPPRAHPKPRIPGVHTAVVTGDGDEIHTDEHGRVKVKFHWDRSEAKDSSSSCWIRVNQGWVGAEWGRMFIPRVGQEVIVQFEDGDPDRPMITGAVYNGNNAFPFAPLDHRTRTVWRSRSTPDGDVGNEIHFEDKAGAEDLFVYATKSKTIHVGESRSLQVDKDDAISITGAQSIQVGAAQSTSVEDDFVSLGQRRRVQWLAPHPKA